MDPRDGSGQVTEPQWQGAILYCPVCCTNVDVTEPGEQSFECTSCGTKWSVTVEAKIVAEHSMYG
jgi:hypothetical protein